MTPELIQKFKAARRVSTPLIALETSEPASAANALFVAANGTCPCKLSWDCIQGTTPFDEQSTNALVGIANLMELTSEGEKLEIVREAFAEPLAALHLLRKLPDGSLMIMHNTHRLFNTSPAQSYMVMQAIWNLRDHLKSTGSTLVLLAPSHNLPVELSQDVTLLQEPLPTDDTLGKIVSEIHISLDMDLPSSDVVRSAKSALRGLNSFAAEQATAECMTSKGLNIPALWDRKKAIIEQTKGASFHTQGLKYADIGGANTVKRYFSSLFSGPNRPELVVMIDEFDKQMAGSDASGDNGVGRDILQVMLNQMVENDYPGAIFAGHPGTGKTVLTEAIAMEHGVPLIKADLNAVKGSLMGESEQGIRDFFRMIAGLTGGAKGAKALFVGCVNKMHDSIPPELRRRFTRRGVWFFDLPTAEEKEGIWTITLQRFSIDPDSDIRLPDDANWTGADIYNCVETSQALGISLIEAARYMVPVAVSDPKAISTLREAANNRWLSTTQEGPYKVPGSVPDTSNFATGSTAHAGRRLMKVSE